MAKNLHSINLLIPRGAQSQLLQRLKLILPLTGVSLLLLFVILFLASLIYNNANISRYNVARTETEQVEQKIQAKKTEEGIYTLTVNRLDTVTQILSSQKNFFALIKEIEGLSVGSINVSDASIDNQGNVSFSFSATTPLALDEFVNRLIDKEKDNLFSSIEAHGIVRDKKNVYLGTISLKADKSLIK